MFERRALPGVKLTVTRSSGLGAGAGGGGGGASGAGGGGGGGSGAGGGGGAGAGGGGGGGGSMWWAAGKKVRPTRPPRGQWSPVELNWFKSVRRAKFNAQFWASPSHSRPPVVKSMESLSCRPRPPL